jgi:hypothetical protein
MLQGSSAHADRIDALQDEDLFDQNVEDYEVYSGVIPPMQASSRYDCRECANRCTAPQTQHTPSQKALCMSRSCRVQLRQEWEAQGISMQETAL